MSDGEPGSAKKRKAGAECLNGILKRSTFRIVKLTIAAANRQDAWEKGWVNYENDLVIVPLFKLQHPEWAQPHLQMDTWLTTMHVNCNGGIFDCKRVEQMGSSVVYPGMLW